jgi:hypothetical protein
VDRAGHRARDARIIAIRVEALCHPRPVYLTSGAIPATAVAVHAQNRVTKHFRDETFEGGMKAAMGLRRATDSDAIGKIPRLEYRKDRPNAHA